MLPSRFSAGDLATEVAAKILNQIQHQRVRAKHLYLLERGEVVPENLQAKADELMEQELLPYLTSADNEDDDPVMVEALSIARDLIIARLAQEGCLPPKGIDFHAKALVDGNPAIYEQARKRVEARFAAANAILSNQPE
jgi:hypothetical protein